ncbi:MAG: tripartite tricarboxylate transporter TctB family protein [Pseudolabrys sp.]
MNQSAKETGGAGPSHRGVEIGVVGVFALLGLIAVLGSVKIGYGWGSDGPQAGFFPFYCGLFILVASAVNLVNLLRSENDGSLFADWGQLRQVLSVVIPTTIYVFAIPYLGIYLSSTILIAGFMIWLGRYPPLIAITVAVAMPVVTFLMFEIWFLVPLPKGPIEKMLGF